MRIDGGDFLFLITIGLVIGGFVGWNLRNRKIKELTKHFSFKETNLIEQAKAVISNIIAERDNALEKAKSIEDRLNKAEIKNSQLVTKGQEYENALGELKQTNIKLHEIYTECIENIKKDTALLPSIVEWASKIQEAIDAEITNALVQKDRPALKTAEEVKESRAIARNWKRTADILRNRVALYEAEAPWLVEFTDYTVEEIVEGLRQEAGIQQALIAGSDPGRLFISTSEWASLSEAQRNQLALDRYWEFRQRNAWLAGIQYERFVGYSYEKNGFDVV
jgi:gas vesicle protein